jgi:DNA-binding Lrp family transcriptional regulator
MSDMLLDRLDLELLDVLQDDLPLVSRPWREIGERLGMPEHDLLERVQRLTRMGIIRNISPVLESNRIGLAASTLVGMRVPEECIDEVAVIVNRHAAVSHNYVRDHDYNVWFTVASPDDATLCRTVDAIVGETGLPPADVLNLPSVRRFKISVRFRFSPNGDGGGV